MDNHTRRTFGKVLLAGTAMVGGAGMGGVATCSSTSGIVINPAVIDAIQAAVATACGFVPTVETLVALVGASFPAVAGAATIADTVLAQISNMLCTAFMAAMADDAKLKAPPMAGTVAIHGLHVVNGKIVAF